MTMMATTTTTAANRAVTGSRTATTRPPAAVVGTAASQLALGTLSSFGGVFFGIAGGGWWWLGAAGFAVAWSLWLRAGVGLLRRRRDAHRLGIGLLATLLVFSIFKIVLYGEGAGYVFGSLTVLLGSLALSPGVRRWATR
jgi:hypothetical protein